MRARFRITDQHGRPMRSSARMSGIGYGGPHGYEGARSDRQQTRNWSTHAIPATGETAGGRLPLHARARDTVRNHGKAEGARAKQVDRVIGKGLRFRSRPNADALGVDPLEALAFGRQIEREISLWGTGWMPESDLKRQKVWGQIQRTLYSDRMVAGESLIILRWRPERGTRYATTIQIVDPDRLSNPNDMPDTDQIRQGIEYNEDGVPVAYHIRDRHPNDAVMFGDLFSWTRVPKLDEFGRPVCVHSFSETRSEQDRGISAFASVLLAFRDVKRFEEAELGAAIINALFTAFIKSNFDPMAVGEALGLEDWVQEGRSWQDARLSMLPDKLSVMDNNILIPPPGDEVIVNNTQRQTAGYEAFTAAVERGIAAGLGMDTPSFTGNLSNVNYSSYRGGLLDAWRKVTGERFEFESDTAIPVLSAVIMEAFDRGHLVEPEGFPPFEENQAAYLAGRFIGPGRGTVDPVKEAKGAMILNGMGVRSLSAIAADLGDDFEEVLDEIATDRGMAEDRELSLASLRDLNFTSDDREPDDAS